MPVLEFKYKRRVYKQMKLDLQQVKKYHSKANLRAFMEAIRNRQADKVDKMLEKCLDPNFHEESSGETPLTQAASIDKSEAVVLSLINGGAHLDFRNKKGLTAVHVATLRGHAKVLETLLDLRASPNYKDNKGMTPLYLSVLHNINPAITEILLKDQAEMNTGDDQGWREIHQAARYGRLKHLEHLLYYGADVDVQNAAGNTALHVCALYKQETAARTLLFRGADRHVKNKASQTAFQVAIVANNFDLAETIRNFSETNVVPFQDLPQYSKRKRFSTLREGSLQRTSSEPYLDFAGSRLSLVSNNSNPEHRTQRGPSTPMNHRKVQEFGQAKMATAIVDYTAQEPGELTLRKGDQVEVFSIGEYNFWQGRVGQKAGWFPSYCIKEMTGQKPGKKAPTPPTTYKDGDFVDKHHAQSTPVGSPRIVFVERGKKGFGFVLRGAKSPHGPSATFIPTEDFPALQYLENVDKGSPADKAGLKKETLFSR
ncbi:SH3 and multiple ankyrin repeat domains protein 3-like isoform X1 [Amphiura filiformis]|uniref:SH3 and multiple ankyrin repeat domains protein 3-like isoform X1 n=1 Tax=Amphiura filiformis TaxID=82378 RepID=UPI003B21ECB3